MSAAPRYDRKARLALGVLGVLFVAPLAISLHNCVSTVQSRNEVIAAAAADDDRLVKLRNGSSLLLDRSLLGPKVIEWLKLKTDGTTAFELADSNFKPNSADTTGEGSRAIAQVAQILKADPQLRANVIVARSCVDDNTMYDLERRQGRPVGECRAVPSGGARRQDQCTWERPIDATHVIDHPGQNSRLFIVISR